VPIPDNVIVAVSESGSMNQELMEFYIDKVLQPDNKGEKSMLIMDEFGAHKTERIKNKLARANIDPFMIPGGYTSLLQPLDVSLNKPMKQCFRQLYTNWQDTSDPKFTAKGNRKRPSYEMIFRMVDGMFHYQAPRTVVNADSFRVSGLGERPIWECLAQLNGKLKAALNLDAGEESIREFADIMRVYKPNSLLSNHFAYDNLSKHFEKWVSIKTQTSINSSVTWNMQRWLNKTPLGNVRTLVDPNHRVGDLPSVAESQPPTASSPFSSPAASTSSTLTTLSVVSNANSSAYFGDLSSFYEPSVASSLVLRSVDSSYQSAQEDSFLTFLTEAHRSVNEYLEN
jgi:hypothetical protein